MKKLLRMAAILAAACLMFVGCNQPTGGEKPAETPDETPAETVSFDVVDKATVIYSLPSTINGGSTAKVEMTGKNNGEAGFRLYLISGTNDSALSNIYVDFKADGNDYVTGDFSIECELTATNSANSLMVKGPQWGTNIDNITITSIKVNGEDIDVTSGK